MPRYKGAHLTWNDRLTIEKLPDAPSANAAAIAPTITTAVIITLIVFLAFILILQYTVKLQNIPNIASEIITYLIDRSEADALCLAAAQYRKVRFGYPDMRAQLL